MNFEQFVGSSPELTRHHLREKNGLLLYVRKAIMVPNGFVIADINNPGRLWTKFRDFLDVQADSHPDRPLSIEGADQDQLMGMLMKRFDWRLFHKPHEESCPTFVNKAWAALDKRIVD